MPARLQGFYRSAAGFAPTLATLAALGALAIWGARNDWKIPRRADLAEKEAGGGKETSKDRETVKVVVEPGATGNEGSRRIEFPSAESVAKVGIQVAAVELQSMKQFVLATGMLDYDPSSYARLSSRVNGIVRRVEKQIGEPVRAGEILALIDAAEVGKAKAEFLQSLTMATLRASQLQRLRTAETNGVVPERSLVDAEAANRESRIKLFNDQQSLLNLGFVVRISEMEKLSEEQRVRHLRLLGIPEPLRKQLDPDTMTANLLPLTAPFEGRIIQRDAAVGEVEQLAHLKYLFVVADVRRLHIDLDVNPGDMAQIRSGQKVLFQPEGDAAAAVGAVSHISPEVDAKTKKVRIHAELDNRDGRLRANTFGVGRILVREVSNASVVPSEAIQMEGEKALVFVQTSPTVFYARVVQPGFRQGKFTEIAGLQHNERVVATGSYMLKSELQKDKISGDD